MLLSLPVLLLACLLEPATQPVQRGHFQLKFDQASPLATKAESLRRFHWRDPIGEIDLSQESFQAYVPEAYDPAEAYGLLVWISPTPRGDIPDPSWAAVLDKSRLIFIGANASGNKREVADRIRLAIDAVYNLKQRYNISDDRIYVCGFSGGGRSASMCATSFSEVFAGGGFYICGVNFFRDTPVPGKKNEFWPAQFYAPLGPLLSDQKRYLRYVLMTGDKDFNLDNTTAVYNAYLKEGYQHVTLLQVPDMSHDVPDADWFEKGIAAMEEPREKIAALRATTRAAAAQRSQARAVVPATRASSTPATRAAEPPDPARDAEKLLNLARSYITAGAYAPARLRLQTIISTYPNTPQARTAQSMLDEIRGK
jgi:dienelactone hydrolase